MRRCEDEQMWRWADVKMSRCEDEKMWRWADVKMSRCEDEQMWRWEGVKMRRCEDEKVWEKVWRWEKMRYRPPLLEEPCAQTLSGKKQKKITRGQHDAAYGGFNQPKIGDAIWPRIMRYILGNEDQRIDFAESAQETLICEIKTRISRIFPMEVTWLPGVVTNEKLSYVPHEGRCSQAGQPIQKSPYSRWCYCMMFRLHSH